MSALQPTISWPDASRRAAFEQWLSAIAPRHGLQPLTLAPASADASFRRYLRIEGRSGSLIVMDAPPALEPVQPFVHVATLLAEAGYAPEAIATLRAEGAIA